MRDISDNYVAAGVPTGVIKSIGEYLEKAKKNSLHLGKLGPKEKAKKLKKYLK